MSPLDLFLPIRAGGMGTVSGCCNGHDANLEEQRDSKMKDPPPAEMVPEICPEKERIFNICMAS
ncbi:unnamed protein product [Effrenium voratum]|uniref:Uncharacterized protein n=1 Tax=Effrenium voratum TaxID=2562239 RepID=A0AA36HXI4_9DINO|nr:unnamed protein product [Effrenium voratum]